MKQNICCPHCGVTLFRVDAANNYAINGMPNIDEMLLDDTVLSFRIRHALKYENVNTVGELRQKSESELYRLPNFGRRSLDEVKLFLQQYNLELAK
jgi:DNA-directed RNA polymerase alpha subunit